MLYRLTSLAFATSLAAFVLTGCQSKNHDAATAAPSNTSTPGPYVEVTAGPTAARPDDRPRIIAFGDSLTAGYGADVGSSYPDYLQKDLDAQGYRYQVINEGVSGNTTKDGVDRLPQALSLNPAVVIVAFGGNDGLRGLPIATTRANLDLIVATLVHGGARVVLGGITMPPNYGADYVHQFNQTYALLAAKYHVPLLPFLLQNVYGVAGGMQEDGMHATDAGNAQVAKNLLPLVVPLLQKPKS